MARELNEPIWQHDIRDQRELALDCWKVTENLFYRLQFQGQDERLQAAMAAISTKFAEATQMLQAIEGAFLPEPNNER